MKVTRNSVFETNSSSVHTITLGKTNKNLKANPEDAKRIHSFELNFRMYEWGPDTVYTPWGKVSYLMAAIWCTDGYNAISDDSDIWICDSKMIPKAMEYIINSDGMKLIQEAINDYYGKEIELVWNDTSCAPHIDHQSIEDYKSFDEFLKDNDLDGVDKLRNFIFDDGSYIIVGNDNGSY